MRDIRFRAWVPDMFFPDRPEAHYICDWQESKWVELFGFTPDKFAVEQYTGLKDKNGKDIYEGDLCKNRSYGGYVIDSVIFNNGCYAFASADSDRRLDINISETDPGNIEIIGNIHEKVEP